MSFKNLYFTGICALLLIGCGSSSKENSKSVFSSRKESQDERSSSTQSDNREPSQPESKKPWAPQFIQTGLSSGIMIEFTGLKKDAVLNAKYSGIELRRIPAPASDEPQKNLTESSTPVTLNTTINNLRQAFYKVPPGTYIVRHTKDWAEKTFIHSVEVREGSYSVIRIAVNEQPLSQN